MKPDDFYWTMALLIFLGFGAVAFGIHSVAKVLSIGLDQIRDEVRRLRDK